MEKQEITPELRQWAIAQANMLLQRGHVDDDSIDDATAILIETAEHLVGYVTNGWSREFERMYVMDLVQSVEIAVGSKWSVPAIAQVERNMAQLTEFVRSERQKIEDVRRRDLG